MQVYTKINTLYKRYQNLGKADLPNPDWKKFQNLIIPGKFSDSEIEYIKNLPGEAYSKIDGTNSKIAYYPSTGEIKVGGKSDKAQSQHGQFEFLQAIADRIKPQLAEMFPKETAKFVPVLNDKNQIKYLNSTIDSTELVPTMEGTYLVQLVESPIYIYGEYYGAGIQVSTRYRDDNDFVVFDICQQGWWLPKDMRDDICHKLGLNQVPYLGIMSIEESEKIVRNGFKSRIAKDPTLLEEGIVWRPIVPIKNSRGNRIICKIKHCDYHAYDEVAKQFTSDEIVKFNKWYNEYIEKLKN